MPQICISAEFDSGIGIAILEIENVIFWDWHCNTFHRNCGMDV